MLAIPAIVLLVLSVWEVFAAHHDATSVPGDEAWEAAAKVVHTGYRPGDLIVFAPAWNDPVGRMHLGDLIAIHDAARMDAARYGRIWELAIRGAHAPDVTGEPVFAEEIDGIAVRRYERAPAIVTADLRERLATAKVEGTRARGPVVELQEVGFAPHECILVATGAGPVKLTFPLVPLGSELVGYAGIADVFTRRDNRLPGRIQVAVHDVLVADRALGVDDGWVRFAATTAALPDEVTVTLSSDAPGRQICFAIEARR